MRERRGKEKCERHEGKGSVRQWRGGLDYDDMDRNGGTTPI